VDGGFERMHFDTRDDVEETSDTVKRNVANKTEDIEPGFKSDSGDSVENFG